METILVAAAPLLSQLLELTKLWVTAKKDKYPQERIDTEVARIIRRASDDNTKEWQETTKP